MGASGVQSTGVRGWSPANDVPYLRQAPATASLRDERASKMMALRHCAGPIECDAKKPRILGPGRASQTGKGLSINNSHHFAHHHMGLRDILTWQQELAALFDTRHDLDGDEQSDIESPCSGGRTTVRQWGLRCGGDEGAAATNQAQGAGGCQAWHDCMGPKNGLRPPQLIGRLTADMEPASNNDCQLAC